jgi:methionine synthase I (cobalamin-dependent)
MSWSKRNVLGTSCWMDGWMDGWWCGYILMVEKTIFDTLNCESGPVFATIGEYLDYTGMDVPVFVSDTFVDPSGRTLSGPTGEAFDASICQCETNVCGIELCIGRHSIWSRLWSDWPSVWNCFFTCVFQCWITQCDGRIG